jgi:hypothetical protein
MIYLVEEQANPSTDYFLLSVLTASKHEFVRCGLSDLPKACNLTGATVIFARYVSSAWVRLVEAQRKRIHRLVFFMDDDVLDIHASVGMPLRYRFKLARLAAWRRGWLQKQGAELWVSTPWLLQKYAAWQPQLVLPSPTIRSPDVRRVFYHGTASHAAEIRWLRPVVEEALGCDERLAFEIIGGSNVYRLYRGMPRVNVVHPMKWAAYQAFLTMPGRHIGLAPLLDLPFNQARSCTKFFDITNCGAVGIYSSSRACDGVVTHGVDGLLLPLDQQVWLEAIQKLAMDEPLRQTLLRNARENQIVLSDKAKRVNSTLFPITHL